MPVKYQPDLIYLRHVKTRRIHLFTLVQTICFAAIMVVKEITITSLAFPLTVRTHLLLLLFTTRRLLPLVAYIFRTKHDINNRLCELITTRGLLHRLITT